ncbi:retrovirus-related pol polyprotein from transposon TNT 1-94, partial [Tanacetum coccineum]
GEFVAKENLPMDFVNVLDFVGDYHDMLRCKAALAVLPVDMEAQTKAELTKKAHSAVILCLGNKVLREVTRETTTSEVWSKLKTFDMTIHGQQVVPEVELFTSYEHFVDTLLYGREALTLEDVMATLNSKEIKERSKAKGDDDEGLYVRGRTDRKDSHQSRGKSRSKSRGYAKKDEQPSSSGSTYDDSEVMMVMSAQAQALLDCIMDSGCSYHMTPSLDILFDFLECDGGSVQLGANRECKIRGIGKSGKIKVINGSRVVLSRIRRDNCVYSLDGHALEGGTTSAGNAGAVWQEKHRRVWVYILRFKHKAFGKFKEWKQLVENQTGRTVKKLRTDNGLECCNREFEQLCIKSGIVRHLTITGMPSPLTAIKKKTPMEMWSGNPSDYGMLRIFSCGVKGYRLYRLDGESPKIVTSRSVVFNESVMYKDTLKDSGAGDQETNQPPDLTDYQLVQDREPRTRTEPLRFRDEIACKDNSKWKAAMEEEMDSLRKNKTWETAFLHGKSEERSVLRDGNHRDYEQGNRSYAPGEYIYLSLYVDDMLIACKSKAEIGSTKSLLKKEFDMKELEGAKKILDNGKSVKMPLGGHFKLSLKDCPVRDYGVEGMSKVPYANAIGSLIYLMVCTRPDIEYVISVVSRYLANPGKNHWEVVKWILKYLRGTTNMGLMYGTDRGNHVDITCFVNSNYAKDPDKEYMALTDVVKEGIWLRGLLEELGVEFNTVAVNCDNQGVIHLSRNHVFHERTKHINVRYHFIREVLEAKTLTLSLSHEDIGTLLCMHIGTKLKNIT